MIGYHYTTWDAYQSIQMTGLHLSPLPEQHEEKCREVMEFVEEGCIWVYPELMQGLQQVGQVFYVAIHHDRYRIVCLKAEYPEWHSASSLAQRKYENDPDEVRVNLSHDLFGAGLFGHSQKHFDLITESVPPDQIQLVGEWNLLKLIQNGERQLRAIA